MKLYAIARIDEEGIISRVIAVEKELQKATKALQTYDARRSFYQLKFADQPYKWNYSYKIIIYQDKLNKKENMVKNAIRKLVGKEIQNLY